MSTSVLCLIKLAHQDSCLRFSVIGNWLKLQAAKSSNEIQFLKSIKAYSKVSNIRQTIVESIGLGEMIQYNQRSFLLNAKRFQLEIEEFESFYVMDYLCLEYADRNALLNQSVNLKYLVWHTLVNSQLKKCASFAELHKCLPYCKEKNFNIINPK